MGLERIKCCLCGSKESKTLVANNTFGQTSYVLKCQKCGFIFLSLLPSKEVVERYYREAYYAPFRPQRGKLSKHPFWKIKFKIKFFISTVRAKSQIKYLESSGYRVKDITGKEKKILDVGCGNGSLLCLFQRMDWEVFGVEPNPDFARFTQRQLRSGRILSDTFERCHFPEESFDLITMSHTFEHFLEPLGILKKVKHLLKKEGLLFLEVPNACDQRIASTFFRSEEFHFFTPQTLTRMLKKMGFNIILMKTEDPLELLIVETLPTIKRAVKELRMFRALVQLFSLVKNLFSTSLSWIIGQDSVKYCDSNKGMCIRALARR